MELLAVVVGVVAGVLAGQWVQARKREKELSSWAPRLNLDLKHAEPGRGRSLGRKLYGGLFEGVPVEVESFGQRIEVRARFRAFVPGRVHIEPRRKASAPVDSGNPVLDLVASVEHAPAELVALLSDPANADEVMRVLHGYEDWEIDGKEVVVVTIGFDKPVDEYTLENTLRAVAALARRLEVGQARAAGAAADPGRQAARAEEGAEKTEN